jgi:putative solute:sodium symporter small subunit
MVSPPPPPSRDSGIDVHDPRIAETIHRYWRTNVRIMAALLLVWAAAGLGCGVLFADALNRFRIGGFPLGFWFAQQGSIVVFVLVILVYCLALNRLDAQHHTELERIRADRAATAGSTRRS